MVELGGETGFSYLIFSAKPTRESLRRTLLTTIFESQTMNFLQ